MYDATSLLYTKLGAALCVCTFFNVESLLRETQCRRRRFCCCVWHFSSLCLSLRAQQPSGSCRKRAGRRLRLLPVPFLAFAAHLPSRPVPAQRRRVGLLPTRSQPGRDAQRQPVVSDRAVLPPPAGARRCQSAGSTHRQLQLRQRQRWAANPGGAPARPTPSSATEQQPCDAELEGERSSGGAQSGIHAALDTGADFLLFEANASLFIYDYSGFIPTFLSHETSRAKKIQKK